MVYPASPQFTTVVLWITLVLLFRLLCIAYIPSVVDCLLCLLWITFSVCCGLPIQSIVDCLLSLSWMPILSVADRLYRLLQNA